MLEFVGNNLLWVTLWFALLILLFWNFFSDTLLGIVQLGPMDATRRINHDNALVIDLRSQSDYKSGHILNSINIPDGELTDRKNELEKHKERPLIMYCQNGTVSSKVVRQLKMEGFEDISCLKIL